ncbi:MAG TPA: hypothetical protein VJN96_22530 [Vicinamibacterales bacterium]|nr:hypothetical protein [Vicinamibacterales bacterium]
MSDQGAVMALKNAWNGVVAASDRVREVAAAVQGLPDETAVKDLDLETYHKVTMAQANALMALRGLVEQLQQKTSNA